MKEKAVVFGEGGSLSGVISEPAAGSRTGVLLFNAGILHRVGPGRLHVKLARALADAGFPVLRFDFSGIGESEARSDSLPYDERTAQEARAAMDLLSRSGADRFLIFGICSGADNGLHVAVAEHRVLGVALVALFSFGSRAYWIDRYVHELFTAAFWARAVRARLDLVSTVRNLANPAAFDSDDIAQSWTMPPAEKIVADLHSLLERGVRLLLVYTPRSPGEFNYRSIVRPEVQASAAGGLVEVEMFAGSDHTLTPLPHQDRLVERVVEWVRHVDAHA